MTTNELKLNSDRLKGKLKQQFEVLADNDLLCYEVKEQEMN